MFDTSSATPTITSPFRVIGEGTCCRPADGSGADFLVVFAPGTERFDYYRLLDRLHVGRATVQDLHDTQDRFDNHDLPSRAWEEAQIRPARGART
jgi:hypothetical protein